MKHYLVIFSLLMTLSPLSARAGGIPVFDAREPPADHTLGY